MLAEMVTRLHALIKGEQTTINDCKVERIGRNTYCVRSHFVDETYRTAYVGVEFGCLPADWNGGQGQDPHDGAPAAAAKVLLGNAHASVNPDGTAMGKRDQRKLEAMV